MTDQNFANNFLKESPKEHSCEIISKSDRRFRRFLKNFFHVRRVQEAHSPEPCLWMIKIFQTTFEKEHSCEIISKSDQHFPRRRLLKNCLKKFHFIVMATRLFDGIKFCEQFLKRSSQGTFQPSLVQIGPAVREEKMFK